MAVYRVNVSFAGNKHSELIDIDAEHPYWQPYIANGYLTPHVPKAAPMPTHMGITDPENFRLPDPTPLSAPVVTGFDAQRLRPVITDPGDEDFGVPV